MSQNESTNTLELPTKMYTFLVRAGGQLFEQGAGKVTIEPQRAFAACLVLANNNPREATIWLNELMDAVDEWNGVQESRNNPFPAL